MLLIEGERRTSSALAGDFTSLWESLGVVKNAHQSCFWLFCGWEFERFFVPWQWVPLWIIYYHLFVSPYLKAGRKWVVVKENVTFYFNKNLLSFLFEKKFSCRKNVPEIEIFFWNFFVLVGFSNMTKQNVFFSDSKNIVNHFPKKILTLIFWKFSWFLMIFYNFTHDFQNMIWHLYWLFSEVKSTFRASYQV